MKYYSHKNRNNLIINSLFLGFVLVLLTLIPSTNASVSNENLFVASNIKGSIVKIYTVANEPNYQQPWNTKTRQSSGSGSIIAGNKILTNAHVVANNTFIQVKRYGETKQYKATLESISHDADLAILTVKDKAFFIGATPLNFGKLPKIQQKVAVYGYPQGGGTLSVTEGVVSRIEHQEYAHSGENLLSVQIDAAINPGNSGGPVISNGKIVGVVMQVATNAENIGYMVPVPIIKHIFTDLKDHFYDGFPDIGIVTQMMQNTAIRENYKLPKNTTGILVNQILHNSPSKNILKIGDIITAIDGHNITNDGSIEFRPKEYLNFSYLFKQKQVDEKVKFKVFRNKKFLEFDIALNKTSKDFSLIQNEKYSSYPRYFIMGGAVFTPLTRNYIGNTKEIQLIKQLLKGAFEDEKDRWITKNKREIVILSQVLPADINKGYHKLVDWRIDTVNGKTFKDFNEFFHLINNIKDSNYIVLADKSGYQFIIDRKKAQQTHTQLLKMYHIYADRSKDLQKLKKTLPATLPTTKKTAKLQ